MKRPVQPKSIKGGNDESAKPAIALGWITEELIAMTRRTWQPFYQREFGYKAGDFPAAETQYHRAMSLPIFPTMTKEQVQAVIEAVAEITAKFKR